MQTDNNFALEVAEVSGLVGDVLNQSVFHENGDSELQFLLQRVSMQCPAFHSAILWVDVEGHRGDVLSETGTLEQLISRLQLWVAQPEHSDGEQWISELNALISMHVRKNQRFEIVCTSLQAGRLRAVAIFISTASRVTCLPGNLRQEVQDALPVALVMHHHRLEPPTILDSSTLLVNRDSFVSQVETEIQQHQTKNCPFAVAIIDLDRFMFVNDAYGPLVADEILRLLAQRLLHGVSMNDLVARLGGDEFAVLIRDTSELKNLVEGSAKLAALMRIPLVVNGHTARITASIGIAVWSPDMDHLHHLFRNANTALHYVKNHGKDGTRLYDNTLVSASLSKIALEDELDKALERQDFRLVYQPRVSVNDESIESAEALIRWHHPVRGMISPGDFIPVAEESRLIVKIGDWVLSEVCRQLHEWKQAGFIVPRIAVNVSPKQLVRHRFLARLEHCMNRFEIAPHNLEIEITETALVEYGEEMMCTVNSLRGKGIQVAVDDFGTGYSSLETLKRFPTDYLKIDQSFVQDLNGRNKAIVSMIIQLAHSIDSKVIAEGVETVEQRDFLVGHGCDEMQGYLYSRPLSPDDLIQFMCRKLVS